MPPSVYAYLSHLSTAITENMLAGKAYALYYQQAVAGARVQWDFGIGLGLFAIVSGLVFIGYLKKYSAQDNFIWIPLISFGCFGFIAAGLLTSAQYGMHYPQVWAVQQIVAHAIQGLGGTPQ